MAETGKGLGNLGILITGFIAVLLGVVLIQIIGTNVEGSDVIETSNESITITSAEGQTSETDKLTAIIFFGNSTNNTNSADITIGTDVNFTKKGVITVGTNITNNANMSVFSDGTYNITYTFEGALFVSNATARTLLKLVMIFFAIGVMAIAIAMFREAFPDLF